jgi:hypothetical protein
VHADADCSRRGADDLADLVEGEAGSVAQREQVSLLGFEESDQRAQVPDSSCARSRCSRSGSDTVPSAGSGTAAGLRWTSRTVLRAIWNNHPANVPSPRKRRICSSAVVNTVLAMSSQVDSSRIRSRA